MEQVDKKPSEIADSLNANGPNGGSSSDNKEHSSSIRFENNSEDNENTFEQRTRLKIKNDSNSSATRSISLPKNFQNLGAKMQTVENLPSESNTHGARHEDNKNQN